ncbi:MAG: hypothetical protein ACLFPR_15150 [Desulfococcaceae bacterium]
MENQKEKIMAQCGGLIGRIGRERQDLTGIVERPANCSKKPRMPAMTGIGMALR